MSVKKTITVLVLTAGAVLFLFTFGKKAEFKKDPLPVAITERPGIPLRIYIPAINVDAAIEQTGITSDGSMGVPEAAMDTAWYKLGSRPGEIGSAVIDGHVDWINGEEAIFKDLFKLKIGDEITVKDETGKILKFLVTKVQSFPQNSDDTEVFVSNDGKAHLNLITCSGTWDENVQSFSKRLVVFADKE